MKRLPAQTVRHTIANGAGYYNLHLPQGEQAGDAQLIVGGWLSTPADYEHLANEMAMEGHPVIVPNLLDPLPGEPDDDPLEYRLAILHRSLEDILRRYHWERVEVSGHSFGGPTGVQLLEDAPVEVGRMNFVSAVGFDNSPDGALLNKFMLGMTFGITELMPSIVRQVRSRNVLRRLAVAVAHAKPHDVVLRHREVQAIGQLGDFNISRIQAGQQQGVPSIVYGGHGDHLVSWPKTVEVAAPVVGEDNIREIHPSAAHLAPQDFAHRVAHHLLDKIVRISSGDSKKAA